ncbi:type II secretion system F family protein [Trueperella sp.]|uniref:type II secretion system F family protein n=1 Tax=Trueperella sp. TaxID=2699835 RepID=UPI00373596D1
MIWLAMLLLVGYVTVPRVRVARSRKIREKTKRSSRKTIDLGAIVTEVASRLRSGSSPERAWAQTLSQAGLQVGAPVLDEAGVPVALRKLGQMGWRERRKAGVTDVVRHTLPATFAVCTMSYRTGAPMAEVLDACAAGITESGEARSARDVALAGPLASARMLAALPIFGLGLGWALGADPIGFLFTTLIGRVALVVGLAFELAGVAWTARLVAEARAAEEEQ